MDCVVQGVNVWVLFNGLELLRANDGRFETNKLLFKMIQHYLLDSQVTADVGCARDVVNIMNQGYNTWGALKSVLPMRICDKC